MASIDDLVGEVAGLGVSGLVLIFLMAVSGYAGAAALTTALAALGGPFGMLGGIGVLFLLTRISKAIAKKGVDNFAKEVMGRMIENGKSKSSLLQEIDKFPLISADLREKVRNFVNEYQPTKPSKKPTNQDWELAIAKKLNEDLREARLKKLQEDQQKRDEFWRQRDAEQVGRITQE